MMYVQVESKDAFVHAREPFISPRAHARGRQPGKSAGSRMK